MFNTVSGCSAITVDSATSISDSGTDVAGVELTCDNIADSEVETWCVGEDKDDDAATTVCAYKHWTCMSCATGADSGVTEIHVQSNGMPNKCWSTTTDNPNVADY